MMNRIRRHDGYRTATAISDVTLRDWWS